MANELYADVQCPLCSQLHRYSIDIKRATTLSMSVSVERGSVPRRRAFYCPIKDRPFECILAPDAELVTGTTTYVTTSSSSDEVQTGLAQPILVPVKFSSGVEISHHDRAILDAGRTLLIESGNVARDFSKHMITVAITAIPVYISLLGLLSTSRPNAPGGVVMLDITPIALFLLAFIVFTLALFPQKNRFSLDIPNEIEAAREASIRHRRRFLVVGQVLFIAGVLGAVWRAALRAQ